MALLTDYALTPDVFDVSSYRDEEVCSLNLKIIKDVLLTEGLVRNLRNGEWLQQFSREDRSWHRHGKELLRKLASQGRFVLRAPENLTAPSEDHEWCSEAIASHRRHQLRGGIIVTERVRSVYPHESIVARIDQLGSAPWWNARSSSLRLGRTINEYCNCLDPLLRCANSIMFIDPHLDPSRLGYRDFGRILQSAGNRIPAPLVEIHRVCYQGSGPARVIHEQAEMERRYRDALTQLTRAAGLQVDIFVWDDFHDRYVISNILGVSVPNGFDSSAAPDVLTTWTRLGRSDRDDIQREFDPASGRHALRYRFKII